MSQILGVNDPYVIPGTMGGGGTSLPVDSAGYLYNDGAGNLSYDTKPTPEPAGSDHEIQWNDSGTMGASSNLTYNGEKLDLDTTISSHVGGAHTISYGLDLADTINATESTGGWIYGTRTHRAINIVGSIPATNRIRTNLYGEYIRLTDSSVFDETVYAAGYLRANNVGPPSNGESVVLGTVTYTFKTTLASEGDVKIAATMQETLENLMDAVNGTGTVGVEHQCTTANADAICTSVTTTGLPVITFQAKTAGTPGDSVAFTESCARLAVNITGATTLGRSVYQNSLYWADVSLSGSTAKGSSMYGVNLMMNGNSFPGNQSQQQYAFVAQMICNGSDETHTRGEMGGINIAMNTFGGRPSSMRGFIFSPQVANDAATYFGSTPEVTGFYCGDIQGGAVGKVDVAYGLYVADLNGSSAAATTAYGIYIAGSTQNNYIAGNLEVAGTLIATVPDPVIGTDTQVIFNDTGALVGSAEFTYTKTSAILGLTRTVDDADGPQMVFTQSRGVSASANDSIGLISFKGYDETCTLTEFARIQSYILDATDGTEDGKLSFQIMCQGVWREAMRIERNTNNFYGVLIGDAASPLAALHVESTSLDFAYAVKFINTWANRGAIDAQGSDVDGIGIRTQGGTGIHTIGRKNGGAAIVAEVDTNYDGYSVRAVRNSSVTTGYPVIAAWCADTIGSGQTILEIMSDCYNLGRTPAGYFITAKNYTTEVFSFDYTGTFKTTGRIHIDNVPNDDTSVTGIITTATAGEALAFGDICYLGADGLYYKSDADASTTMPAVVMATGTIAASASGKFLEFGYARNDAWDWTPGGLIYADTTTAGGMTQTAPTGSGDQVQIVGYAYSADVVKFMPQLVIVEV